MGQVWGVEDRDNAFLKLRKEVELWKTKFLKAEAILKKLRPYIGDLARIKSLQERVVLLEREIVKLRK